MKKYCLYEDGLKIIEFQIDTEMVTANLLNPDGTIEYVSCLPMDGFINLLMDCLE
jgi:hypothetical protein